MVIKITTYAEAREAFRCRDLRQALYDEGDALMHGVIVNLHGESHIARRRLENRLFRRDTFQMYESERIPAIIRNVMAPALAAGRGDLLPLARRAMMALSIDVAGVDRPAGTDEELDQFYALMDRLAKASVVAHATGNKEAIIADGNRALAEFETIFFKPSLDRRQALVDEVEGGRLQADDLPRDVLTTLLLNHDRLDLSPGTVLREIAYYPWVGSHSTSNQFVHAMHHIFDWLDAHPDQRAELSADLELVQRFAHESIRLHPSSPVSVRKATADIAFKSGRTIAAGEDVVIDLVEANRDPKAVGAEPAAFNPFRKLSDGVPPWGLSFGHGAHACLGQELAGGIEADDALDHHLLGTIAIMAGEALAGGARRDPANPALQDEGTTREMWGQYPVLFGPVPSNQGVQ